LKKFRTLLLSLTIFVSSALCQLTCRQLSNEQKPKQRPDTCGNEGDVIWWEEKLRAPCNNWRHIFAWVGAWDARSCSEIFYSFNNSWLRDLVDNKKKSRVYIASSQINRFFSIETSFALPRRTLFADISSDNMEVYLCVKLSDLEISIENSVAFLKSILYLFTILLLRKQEEKPFKDKNRYSVAQYSRRIVCVHVTLSPQMYHKWYISFLSI